MKQPIVFLVLFVIATIIGVHYMIDYSKYKFSMNKNSMEKIKEVKKLFQPKIYAILAELETKGYRPIVAEGLRTLAQENVKIKEGNTQLSNPKRSRHTTGDAVDIVDARYGWEGPAANLKFKFWTDLGIAAREQGLEWGGDWHSFKDVAHVQVPRSMDP